MLGAGQGPLVAQVIWATKEVRTTLDKSDKKDRLGGDAFSPRIFAVEKNPKALPR